MTRKNVIENIVVLLMCVAAIVGMLLIDNEKDVLQETLNEKEKVISDMETRIAHLTAENIQMSQQFAEVSQSLKSIQIENEALQVDNKTLQQKVTTLEKKAKQLVIPSRDNSKVAKEFYVESTAYTAYCKGCSGKTAWKAIDLRANPELKVIAVDPSIIPLGTKVWVEGYGYAVAADTGGSIKGNKIDVFIPTKSAAKQWGRKTVHIKVF